MCVYFSLSDCQTNSIYFSYHRYPPHLEVKWAGEGAEPTLTLLSEGFDSARKGRQDQHQE